MSPINPHPFINQLHELYEVLQPIQTSIRTAIIDVDARAGHLESVKQPAGKHHALRAALTNLDLELTTVLVQLHTIV